MKTTHKIYCLENLGLGKIKVKLPEYKPLTLCRQKLELGLATASVQVVAVRRATPGDRATMLQDYNARETGTHPVN